MIEKVKKFIGDRKISKIEKVVNHMKVTPELFSHDETKYYIDTLVGLKVILESGKEKIFRLYEENLIEIIGIELELDLHDFLDFETKSNEFLEAQKNLDGLYNDINS